ncbi:hypothetical protein CKAN_00417600 [Cinnamomum micranthum f. kanehirae]|uniref:Uncharacterized protein n=1 Tax=Cinnamomum micranthum f. kanehirae TaxID=337451 RepID=A0A443NB95_9MAGN|nr:hypothetical protein CKAN_00417600 [Cinnamomum micranthum f. kanehirae]
MPGYWPLIRETAIAAAVTAAVTLMINAVPGLVVNVSTLILTNQSVFDAGNKVENLRFGLTKIQHVIRDAENLPMFENQADSDWLEKLKEEVQNVVDQYERKELSWILAHLTENDALRLLGQNMGTWFTFRLVQVLLPYLQFAVRNLVRSTRNSNSTNCTNLVEYLV